MTLEQRHQDVAAYALGVLEPADVFRFEEHLADCGMCAIRLRDFAAAAAAVAEVAGPGRIEARPSPRLLDRLGQEVELLRRRSRRRRLTLVAAAAALIVAVPAGAVALQESAPAGPPQIVATAKNATTGVTASAALEEKAWGTAVDMRLTGLSGPQKCRLVAIAKNGVEHPVLSWTVPADGFGKPDARGNKTPLDIQGGTDLHSAEIGRWEVRTADGKTLISIGD